MSKFLSGVQMQVHQEYHRMFKELKNERVKLGKEGSGELSDKRFSLTIAKAFKQNVGGIRDILTKVDIDLNNEK